MGGAIMGEKQKQKLSIYELANLSGLSERTLRRYVKERGMPCIQAGKAATGPGELATQYLFDRAASLEFLANLIAERRRNMSEFSDRLHPDDPRFKKAQMQANLLELNIAIAKGEFVRRDAVGAACSEQAVMCKSMLEAIPSRVSVKIAQMAKDKAPPREIKKLLDKEFARALAVLDHKAVIRAVMPPGVSPPADELDITDSDEL